MEARIGGTVYRRLFRLIVKEQVEWISGRAVIPKCSFSSGSFGKTNTLLGSKEGPISRNLSRGCNGVWSKVGLSSRGEDLVMVRRVEGLGGVRLAGFASHRPVALPPRNSARPTLPETDEESDTEKFLRLYKKEQAEKMARYQQTIGKVASQSLAATDTQVVEEADLKVTSDTGHQYDLNDESLVDEDVRRGLMADSALPIGRREKKVDEEEHACEETGHPDPENRVDVSEHGSFKTL